MIFLARVQYDATSPFELYNTNIAGLQIDENASFCGFPGSVTGWKVGLETFTNVRFLTHALSVQSTSRQGRYKRDGKATNI
ncbi:hypothetical protein Bra5_PB00006 (plasmid) [Rhizobium phaseoli Brasil 5]|nr:hypothetical protein Bra5_PB00006 [Rhizobium phaseoli Brasil 5]